jgi:hypothetical protein
MFNQVNKKRFGWLTLAAVVIALIIPGPAAAAPPAQDSGCAMEYTVQADDWLSKLAEKYLGNAMDYPQIAEATNQAHESDPRFAQIGEHDFIEIGWLLCIPAAPEETEGTGAEATQPEQEAQRIEFAAGGTTAFESAKLAKGDIDRYVLTAQENQLMWVSLWTQEMPSGDQPDAILVIWGADGTVLISDHAGATDWNGSLPMTQDYYIDVSSTGQAEADYTLGIGIPAPVQADPNLTQTEVVEFKPTMPDGTAQEGSCWTSSNLLLRDDAWRCNVGENEISDPCFSIEGNSDVVVCGADPVTGDAGFQLKLTAADGPGAANRSQYNQDRRLVRQAGRRQGVQRRGRRHLRRFWAARELLLLLGRRSPGFVAVRRPDAGHHLAVGNGNVRHGRRRYAHRHGPAGCAGCYRVAVVASVEAKRGLTTPR